MKWVVALTVSGVLHAGAAALLLPEMDSPEIAGGEPTQIAVQGNAFADQSLAGQVTDTVDPVRDTVSETKPVEAAEIAPEPVEATAPVETAAVNEPSSAEPMRPPEPEVAETVESAEMSLTQPEAAETAKPAETREAEIAIAASDRPVEETPQADIAVAPLAQTAQTRSEPARRAARAEPVESEAAEPRENVEPVEAGETVTAMVDVPRPTPRPEYTPPKRTERPDPEPREAKKTPRRQASGNGGQNQADTQRGATGGRQKGSGAQESQQSARANAAGNAAVSNYPGKVVRKLRRALRFPSAAKRDRIEGEVHVRFTIARSGAVSGVRVARSSGSAVLDQAAMATVRRAAPFPNIPDAAGRSSWPFTVPLAFIR